MPHQQTSNSNSPPSLFASWSLGYITCGQPNSGQLTLQLTTKGASVALNSGHRVSLGGLPSGWTISTVDPGWSVSSDNTYLTWGGSNCFPVNDATPATINLTVTPPANATSGGLQIEVQLQDATGIQLSYGSMITFNLTEPSDPIVAYAQTPALAIITAPSACPYPNTMTCKFAALTSSNLPDAVDVEISLHARDKDNNKIAITQSARSDAISISTNTDTDFKNNGDGTWSARIKYLTASSLTEMQITIDGLVLQDANISVLEVQCQLTGAKANPYNTSAWFTAVGPYSITLTRDDTNSNARKYRIYQSTPSKFMADFVAPGLNQPPLVMQVVDARGQQVNPPVPGGFSWQQDSLQSQSEYQLSLGANTLYWLDCSEPSALKVLASCTITLNQLTANSTPPLCFTGMDLSGQDLSAWKNLDGVVSGNVAGNPPLPSGWKWIFGYLVGPGANLSGADFSNAPDANALVFDVAVTNTKFCNANLSACNFGNCPNGDGADFTGANMYQTIFYTGSYQNAKFIGADFNQATLGGTPDSNIRFDNADFTGAINFGNAANLGGGLYGVPKALPSGWNYCKYGNDFRPAGQYCGAGSPYPDLCQQNGCVTF